MVRQFDDTRRTRTALLCTTHPDEYADEAEFELAASVLASLGVQALREERELVSLAGDEKLRIEVPARRLDGCSRLELNDDPPPRDKLGPRPAQDVPDATVALVELGAR